MKKYSVSAIDSLLASAQKEGYTIVQIEEGTLGHGHILLLAPRPDWYNAEIQEVYINEWSSAHTVRMFGKFSARIRSLLASVGEPVPVLDSVPFPVS